MSTWLSAAGPEAAWAPGRTGLARRVPVVRALLLAALVGVLIAQGIAISYSYLWAAPLLCLLALALADSVPVVPVVGVALFVRVISSQAVSSPRARYSESLNLSGLIAVGFIVLAGALLLHRRRAWALALGASAALVLWTLVAIRTHGESNLTLREGVREASILAVAIVVCNSRGTFSVSRAVRVVQIAGFFAALLAVYQLVTHSGLDVGGNIRSDGTFTHPNGAAMYFAIATTASLWRYLERGHGRIDALLAALFALATITTFSVGGLASLLVMLFVFGAARPGSLRLKLGSIAVALLVVVAFAASPVGARRLATESATSIKSAQTRGTANTSLAWRFYKWRTLIPEFEQAPLFGRGLGTTVTAEGNSQNVTAGNVPHNEYVRYLVESGALGLALVLGAIFAMTRRLLARRRMAASENVGALGLAVLAGCLANAFGDNTLLYSTTGYAAALIIAAVLSCPAPARAGASGRRA